MASAASPSVCCTGFGLSNLKSGLITPGRKQIGSSWKFMNIGWSRRDAFFVAPLSRGEASLRAGGLIFKNRKPPAAASPHDPLSGGQNKRGGDESRPQSR